MPFYKHVWQFSSRPSGRWSEVYYSFHASLEAARIYQANIKTHRVALLSAVCKWTKIRISEVGKLGVSIPIPVNLQGADVGTGPANLDEAAVITCGAAVGGASRRIWLRGLAEGAVARVAVSGDAKTDANWQVALDAFLDDLCSDEQSFVILSRKRVKDAGIIKGLLQSVTPGAIAGTSVLGFDKALNVVVGGQMVVNNVDQKVIPGLRGVFDVIAIDGNNVTVAYTANAAVIGSAIKKGYGFRLEYKEGTRLKRDLTGFSYLGSRRSKNVDTGSRGARRAQRLRR